MARLDNILLNDTEYTVKDSVASNLLTSLPDVNTYETYSTGGQIAINTSVNSNNSIGLVLIKFNDMVVCRITSNFQLSTSSTSYEYSVPTSSIRIPEGWRPQGEATSHQLGVISSAPHGRYWWSVYSSGSIRLKASDPSTYAERSCSMMWMLGEESVGLSTTGVSKVQIDKNTPVYFRDTATELAYDALKTKNVYKWASDFSVLTSVNSTNYFHIECVRQGPIVICHIQSSMQLSGSSANLGIAELQNVTIPEGFRPSTSQCFRGTSQDIRSNAQTGYTMFQLLSSGKIKVVTTDATTYTQRRTTIIYWVSSDISDDYKVTQTTYNTPLEISTKPYTD